MTILTFRKGALGAPAAAKAMAEYLKQSTLPEAAQRLMTYYTRGLEQLEQDQGSVVEPRSDMHPEMAALLKLDTTKAVSLEELHNLLLGVAADGSHLPGTQRTANYENRDRITYYDFSWSAPKSASVAMALAETDAERFAIVALWRDSVRDGMALLEDTIGFVRKGQGGQKGRIQGHIGWVSVDHFTARPTIEVPHTEASGLQSTLIVTVAPPAAGAVPGDPQLHTHVAVPNVVLGQDGSVGSLDTVALHDMVKEIGGYAGAMFTQKMRDAGIAMEVDERTGKPRVTAVDPRLEVLFSKRTNDGEALARAYVADQGMDYDALHPLEVVQILHGATRVAREDKETNLPNWPAWREQANAAGLPHASVMGTQGEAAPTTREDRLRAAYEVSLPFLDASMQRRSTMLASEARHAAITGLVAAGIEGHEDIDGVTALMREHGVQHMGRKTELIWAIAPTRPGEHLGEDHGRKRRFKITTGLHVAMEAEAMGLIAAAAKDRRGALSPAEIERAVGIVSERDGLDFAKGHGLKQRAVIDTLGLDGGYSAVIGVAGSGKTTLLRPLVHAWQNPMNPKAEPRTVYGVALARRQSDDLAEAGIPKANVMPVSELIRKAPDLKLTPNTVVVVDELSQVGTVHLLDLARLQSKHGFIIRSMGDDKQNQAIEAGSSIHLLQRALGKGAIPELTSSVRQVRDRDKETALLFRAGFAEKAIERLHEDGSTRLIPGGRKEAVAAVAALAVERIQANAADPKWSMSISAPTNSDARAISAAMRPAKRAAGWLGADVVTLQATDQKGVDEFDLPLAVGDKVRFYRTTHATYETGGKRIFAANGGTAEVVAIDPEQGLTMRNRTGRVAFAAWTDLTHEGTGRIQLSYGDAMTIDAVQGATSTEHINALPSGSAASHSFRNYPAQSRARMTTYLVVSQGLEQTEIGTLRALGSQQSISNDDIWKNVARNLSRQPDKELASELLDRATQVFRGTVRGFAASSTMRRRREARGLPPTTAAGRARGAQDERDIAAAAPAMGDAIQRNTEATWSLVNRIAAARAAHEQTAAQQRDAARQAARQARRAARPTASRPKEADRMHTSQPEAPARAPQKPRPQEAAPARRMEQERQRRDAGTTSTRDTGKPPITKTEAEAQFTEALRLAGLRPRGSVQMDGKWHRVAVEGDKGAKKSGSYMGHLDGLPAGFIQNFKTTERVTWKAEGGVKPQNAEERAAERQRIAERQAAKDAERKMLENAAARKAASMWSRGTQAHTHPYLKAKGVQPHGLRQDRYGNLMLAMRDATGDVRNVQTIAASGTKLFVKDGRKQGLYALLGTLEPGAPVVIAEGFATGATMRELTGFPTVVAFDAGNLKVVAEQIRALDPTRQIVFAADNDHHLPLRPGEKALPNVGLEKAQAAALAVGGIVVTPAAAYGPAEDKGTDWNDHATVLGREATRAALAGLLIKQGVTMPTPEEVSATLARPAVSQQQRDAARARSNTAASGAQTGTAQAQASQQQSTRQQQPSSSSNDLSQ